MFIISDFLYTASSEDYQPQSMTLLFGACNTRHCVNIVIVNDLINEPVERFSLSLSTDLALHLPLRPQTSEVAIIDNDGETVVYIVQSH